MQLNQVPNAIEPAILPLNGLRVPFNHVIDGGFEQQEQANGICTELIDHILRAVLANYGISKLGNVTYNRIYSVVL